MPTRVEIHPTARIAFTGMVITFAVVAILLGAKKLLRGPVAAETSLTALENTTPVRATSTDAMLPVIALTVGDASLESGWSAALASALSGQTEYAVESGRVDVLTDYYAIEVDRLDKWHEAIGQAAHYGLKTQKLPVAAIIIGSDLWPLSPSTQKKLRLIDETCLKQGIKLILLKRDGINEARKITPN